MGETATRKMAKYVLPSIDKVIASLQLPLEAPVPIET